MSAPRRAAAIGAVHDSAVATLLSRTANDVARALDARLFTTGPWLAIDAANVAVKGVQAATLNQALALVGQGRVASVVGRLRPEVAGVDIDSAVFADEILNALTDFCAARGLWHLVRPTGGAPGRAHLLLIPGVHRGEFEDLVGRLRRELGRKADPATGRRAAPLGSKHVDVRTQLRPLSAPHRRRPTPQLPQNVLVAALEDLEGVLRLAETAPVRAGRFGGTGASSTGPSTRSSRSASPSIRSKGRARRVVRAERRGSEPHEPSTPLQRPRRDLPAEWAAYLSQGRAAAAAAGLDRDPGSRSTIEFHATCQLVRAGLDEDTAWAAITAAHPTAFVKARSNGRRWWWHVWNAAVDDADRWLSRRRSELAHQPPQAPGRPRDLGVVRGGSDLEATGFGPGRSPGLGRRRRARSATVEAVIAAAEAEVEARWRFWPAQVRHSGLEITRTLFDRMRRENSTSVMLPQRDLMQDGAVGSRNTIAARRDDLVDEEIVRVSRTHVRGTTNTADTWSLHERFFSAVPSDTAPETEEATEPACLPPTCGGSWRSTTPLQGESTGSSRDLDFGGGGGGGWRVGWSDPTRSSPPRVPLHLRRTLGLPRTHVLEALMACSAPATVEDLAVAGGVVTHVAPSSAPSEASVPHGTVQLTRDQRRTARGHLHALADLELALVDSDGRWTVQVENVMACSTMASTESSEQTPSVVQRLHHRGWDLQDAVQASVRAERAEFRARLDPEARRRRWHAQRAQHLARQAKLDAARRKAWWDGMHPTQRHERRVAVAATFAALSPHEQARRKHELALHRARAGIDELDRYQTWWSSLSVADRERRRTVRAWAFQARPEDERAEHVAAWAAHRARWDLPGRRRGPAARTNDAKVEQRFDA